MIHLALQFLGIYGYLIIALKNRPKYSPSTTPGISRKLPLNHPIPEWFGDP